MTDTNNTSIKRKRQQRQAGIQLLILAVILVFVNILASRFHAGIDLTKEKRFTLSTATKRMLKETKAPVVVDVYLTGELPAGFQKLREATREKLQSFKSLARGNFTFRFSDPLESVEESKRNVILEALYKKGVEPVELNVKDKQNSSKQIIFPYAMVRYNGKEQAVRLLENHFGMSPLQVLNYSETLLEYKLANAIHELQKQGMPRIAYLMGNGEQLGVQTFDLLQTISKTYQVDTIDIHDNYFIDHQLYKAIIINKPTLPFDEKDKFKIDQYVMRGGKVLWMIDPLHTPIDSLQATGQFITTDYGLNLDDILFKYGVRINNDLIEDATQCNPIPLITGTLSNGQPQIELRPWTFLPIFIPSSKHVLVNNMDAIMGRFASSIDTIEKTNNSKTILLESSGYSRSDPAPVRVSLSMIRFNPDLRYFNKPARPVAVLIEGRFNSVFENRMASSFLSTLKDSLKYEFKNNTDADNKMIIIADGDIFLNDATQNTGIEEMGYWRYTKTRFANKEFLLNSLEYLTDPNSMLEARSKDLKLRLLDPQRAATEKTQWQFINIVVPIALILFFASGYFFFRKRKYEKKG
ncbi:MAG TPA: gliding motility-associated ABC transporter substrate-binding protein GldG [Flavipsychrobacter sp.]|nr:gliding motility-associated ABC transporter substrate-binding protein GldG [Flavipsychrobacter sp.]